KAQRARAQETRRGLGVVPAAEPGRLRPALVPGLLHDRRDLRVGHEALPAFRVPVEQHPHPVGLVGIAEDGRALGSVLLALLGALGREDAQEAVVVLDLRRCQDHVLLLRLLGISGRRRCAASVRAWTPRRNGANALLAANEVVLEGPERRRGAAAYTGLLVDVLDVVS